MPTQADVARHLDLTGRRVRELVEDGVIPRAGRGEWDLDTARVAYIRYLRGLRQSGEGLDAVAERARRDKESADKLALDNARTRGELVEVAEVERAWIRFATDCKSRLLGLPSKLAPLVFRCRRVDEARGIIETGIHDCLTALADDGASGPRGHASARAPHGQRVGRPASQAKPGGERRARSVAH